MKPWPISRYALDLLDEKVHRLRRAVAVARVVVVQDLGVPGAKQLRKGGELGGLRFVALGDDRVEQDGGFIDGWTV